MVKMVGRRLAGEIRLHRSRVVFVWVVGQLQTYLSNRLRAAAGLERRRVVRAAGLLVRMFVAAFLGLYSCCNNHLSA